MATGNARVLFPIHKKKFTKKKPVKNESSIDDNELLDLLFSYKDAMVELQEQWLRYDERLNNLEATNRILLADNNQMRNTIDTLREQIALISENTIGRIPTEDMPDFLRRQAD